MPIKDLRDLVVVILPMSFKPLTTSLKPLVKPGVPLQIYVGSITGVISAQPINELGQAIGAAMTFSSAGTKYSHMTNQNCNTVHLLIKNKTSDGGTAAVSGRFYNTAS